MTAYVKEIKARAIFDSRGDKTIEVEVRVDGGIGVASVPSGKSRSLKECEPYPKGGVEEALSVVRSVIAPRIRGLDVSRFGAIDSELSEIDGSTRFERIGGNTALATSVATAKAVATSRGVPLYRYLSEELSADVRLPLPLGNILGGGKHAGSGAPDFQEFLVIPLNCKSIHEALEANMIAHKALGSLLSLSVPGYALGRGDEGAYAPPLDNVESLEVVKAAVDLVERERGVKLGIGLDIAGSNLYDPRRRLYSLRSQGLYLSREDYLAFISELADEYNLVYIEDPVWEEDWESFVDLTRSLKRTLVCGDDLLATRAELIGEYSKRGAIKAAIIKPNQVGTLSLTWAAVKASLSNDIVPVSSHRSGETDDAFISHIAVGTGCKVLKAGVVGGERVVKANELLRIAETEADRGSPATIWELHL
ncbi:MAG: hypothetical protein NZ920_03710 [Aigarchaeota archaeon]|nr:hypothetical protein [Aigarchaeota archaeon]MDW8092273.1 hypothetical protein [Nitrososphaerota archaeon]